MLKNLRPFSVFLCCSCCVALLLLAGCGKRDIPGYGPQNLAETVSHQIPSPDELEPGWGYVDVLCRPGVGKARGERDTLFGCLLEARKTGTDTLVLPKGVYLGHVAEFIVRALKFYHVEEHFEHLYGYRVVLVFRPATPEELESRKNAPAQRIGVGMAGEALITLAGGPALPFIAPVLFSFEAISEDMAFHDYKKYAKAHGLPEPTRRGDAIAVDKFGERMEILMGEDEAIDPLRYTVVACYLERPDERIRLVKNQ